MVCHLFSDVLIAPRGHGAEIACHHRVRRLWSTSALVILLADEMLAADQAALRCMTV